MTEYSWCASHDDKSFNTLFYLILLISSCLTWGTSEKLNNYAYKNGLHSLEEKPIGSAEKLLTVSDRKLNSNSAVYWCIWLKCLKIDLVDFGPETQQCLIRTGFHLIPALPSTGLLWSVYSDLMLTSSQWIWMEERDVLTCLYLTSHASLWTSHCSQDRGWGYAYWWRPKRAYSCFGNMGVDSFQTLEVKKVKFFWKRKGAAEETNNNIHQTQEP